MKKILLVFGTRPEAIKMAPLIKELDMNQTLFDFKICITGQHRQMLDQVLRLFKIKPDFDLNIMKTGQDLFDVSSSVLVGMRDVLDQTSPDIVLVHGDTTTSVSAAFAAFYRQIPIGHIEAGLRTYNKHNPWPEEINRQVTSRLADFHFAPTKKNKENLEAEGINKDSIIVTGNTVIDALHFIANVIESDPGVQKKITKGLSLSGINENAIRKWGRERKLILITGHRRESFGEGIISICKAIRKLAIEHPDVDYVYPMHLNPNVRKPIKQIFEDGQKGNLSNVYFIEPIEYLAFILNSAYLILTDSGGIQEEAPGLGKPVLVMRDTTERPEAILEGTACLVGTKEESIISSVNKLLRDEHSYKMMRQERNPFGDGFASKRIVNFLKTLEL